MARQGNQTMQNEKCKARKRKMKNVVQTSLWAGGGMEVWGNKSKCHNVNAQACLGRCVCGWGNWGQGGWGKHGIEEHHCPRQKEKGEVWGEEQGQALNGGIYAMVGKNWLDG